MDHSHGHNRHVTLTPSMIDALRAQRKRTGVNVPELISRHLDPSRQCEARRLHAWLGGCTRFVCPNFYAHVLETWQRLPDSSEIYVANSPSVREQMKAERDRTGVSPERLFSGLALPEGLAANSVFNFYHGKQKRLRREQFNRIMELWKSLPDAGYQIIKLAPAILETLRAYAARTGLGPQALLAGVRDKPEGLTSTVVIHWLNRHSKTARTDHLDYVFARYGAAVARPTSLYSAKLRSALRREIRRTGLSDEEVRRMLDIEEKRSWQFLDRTRLLNILKYLQKLPSCERSPRRDLKARYRRDLISGTNSAAQIEPADRV